MVTQSQYFEWQHLVLLPWLVKLSPLSKNTAYIPDLEAHGCGPWAKCWQSVKSGSSPGQSQDEFQIKGMRTEEQRLA